MTLQEGNRCNLISAYSGTLQIRAISAASTAISFQRGTRGYQAHRDCSTTFQLKDHLWTLFLYEKGLYRLPAGHVVQGCNCARNHLTILPDGDIYACRRMESRVGNVNTDDLYAVWTGAAASSIWNSASA